MFYDKHPFLLWVVVAFLGHEVDFENEMDFGNEMEFGVVGGMVEMMEFWVVGEIGV
jgi:hypothetical protein